MTTGKTLSILAAMTVAFTTTTASAALFTNDYHDAGVWTTYTEETDIFSMKYQVNDGKDGFWLVVSDGPNPKQSATEYAILYGDLANNRITAYTYDGNNGPGSYQTGEYLGTYENPFVDLGNTMPQFGDNLTQLALDVSAINGAFNTADWDGVKIGPEAGIWFHQSAGSQFTYGADGSLLDYSFASQMYLDSAFDTSQVFTNLDCSNTAFPEYCVGTELTGGSVGSSGGGDVPAPGGLALLAAGLFGLYRRKRALTA